MNKKRVFSLVLALAMVLSVFTFVLLNVNAAELHSESDKPIHGDIDGDGEVTILDATAIQRHLASLPTVTGIGMPISYDLKEYDVFCFGDSLTAGSGCTIPYHYFETLYGNYTCYNFGIGGTGYIKEKGSPDNPKYDYKGIGQVGKPDTTVEVTGGNTVLQYFMENESAVTKSTAIVIFAGTNDYGRQCTLEDFETAIRNTYTYILSHHKQPLIVCTPMDRIVRDNEKITLEQYVNKIIAVCTELNIPVIDFYHDVQLRPETESGKKAYYSDNIHLNDLGHQLIGAYFGAKLNEFLGK